MNADFGKSESERHHLDKRGDVVFIDADFRESESVALAAKTLRKDSFH